MSLRIVAIIVFILFAAFCSADEAIFYETAYRQTPLKLNPHRQSFENRVIQRQLKLGSHKRIAHGTRAGENEFPHVVSFVAKGSKYQFCSGSLINSSLILTAAHCFFTGSYLDDPDWFGVAAGENRISSNGRVFLPLYDLHKLWIHPHYTPSDSGKNVNDVALVTLFDDTLQEPMKILESKADYAPYEDANQELTVAGWGKTPTADYSDYLMKTTIQLYSQNYCSTVFSNAGYQRDYMLCGNGGNNRDACAGDSGGYLGLKVNGSHVSIGITSYGAGTCGQESLGGYTRVSGYLDYYDSVMSGQVTPDAIGNDSSVASWSGIVVLVTLVLTLIM